MAAKKTAFPGAAKPFGVKGKDDMPPGMPPKGMGSGMMPQAAKRKPKSKGK